MGQVFKKTTTRPIPAGATIVKVGGKLTARWRGRGSKAKRNTASVVTLDDGRQVIRQESSTYFARYRDQDKALVVVSTGCRDEEAARQVLADLQKRVQRIKAGVLTPAEDAASEQQKRGVGHHVDAYVSTLTGSAMHRENTAGYLRRLVAACRWTRLADMRRSDLECWLSEQVRLKRSARSRNAYQTALVTFCNWCVRDGRMTANPFARMPKANLDADPRRKRRAMTPGELARLIDAARKAPERPALKRGEGDGPKGVRPSERFSGADRADLYVFLAGTGLRVGEARQLRISDLDIDGPVPVVRLSAAITKNGRDDAVPLRADLIALLSRRIAGRRPADRVFNIPADLIRRFHADCRRAGIDRRDDRGRQLDLHALRTTFGTLLARSGVPMRTAQQLMRHSDIRLTANVYVDPALLDLQGAVESLPSVPSVASFVAPSVAQPAGNPCATQSSDDNTSIKTRAS
jgi:integrase